VGGVSTVAFPAGSTDSPSPKEIIRKVQEKYASLSSYSANGMTVSTVIGRTFNCTFNIKLARPNLYRIEFELYSTSTTNSGAVWNSGDGDFMLSHRSETSYSKYASLEGALVASTGMTRGSCEIIPMIFFEDNIGTGTLKLVSTAKNS